MEVYQQMTQMMNDLGTGEAGQGHGSSSTHQVEPQQALAEVQSGGLQTLLWKLHEQMEHAINTRVNQVINIFVLVFSCIIYKKCWHYNKKPG